MDCGTVGWLLATNAGAAPDSLTLGGLVYWIAGVSSVTIPCSGVVEVVAGPAVTVLLMSSGLDVWAQGLVMGLAGVVGGGLIAWTFARAVG